LSSGSGAVWSRGTLRPKRLPVQPINGQLRSLNSPLTVRRVRGSPGSLWVAAQHGQRERHRQPRPSDAVVDSFGDPAQPIQ
jgi:hypothetical protein